MRPRMPPRPKGLETQMTEEFDPLRYDKGYYWTPSRETEAERTSPLAAWNGRDVNGAIVGADLVHHPI